MTERTLNFLAAWSEPDGDPLPTEWQIFNEDALGDLDSLGSVRHVQPISHVRVQMIGPYILEPPRHAHAIERTENVLWLHCYPAIRPDGTLDLAEHCEMRGESSVVFHAQVRLWARQGVNA